MNGTMNMTSDDVARDRIETAWHDYPFCRDCGQSMTIEERNGALWIECISLRDATGLRGRLMAGFHERHLLDIGIESPAVLAA